MKPWYMSRTLIWNALSLLVFTAGLLADNAGLLAIPAQYVGYLALIVAIGNACLRLDTSLAIVGTPAANALTLRVAPVPLSPMPTAPASAIATYVPPSTATATSTTVVPTAPPADMPPHG